MKRQTWIYLYVVDGTETKMFYKCIEGELLIPTEKTGIVAVDGWAELMIEHHYIDVSTPNVVISKIELEKIKVEHLSGDMSEIKKELKNAGFRE